MMVKRAHMVSRGYLRSWADSANRVNVWDLEHRLAGLRSINGATVVSYAYETKYTTLDLEAEYARIEGDGIPALHALADGGQLQNAGREAVVEFLDMHHQRGRFADQAAVKIPAVALGLGIEPHPIEMGLGDRLTLSRDVDKTSIRMSSLGLTRRRWRVEAVESGLATSDGAVMLWQDANDPAVRSVTFPLSPTRLLVIGEEIDTRHIELNRLIVAASRRWIVDRVDGEVSRRLSFAS